MQIRAATPDEADFLSDLALRSKGHWGYDAAFLEACRNELSVDPASCDGSRVFVAEQDGAIVGFYLLDGEPPVGELADLFVDPVAIGTGVGNALFEHARANAGRLGYRALTIDADPFALGFYQHVGAVHVGDVPSGSVAGRFLPRLELAVGNTTST